MIFGISGECSAFEFCKMKVENIKEDGDVNIVNISFKKKSNVAYVDYY